MTLQITIAILAGGAALTTGLLAYKSEQGGKRKTLLIISIVCVLFSIVLGLEEGQRKESLEHAQKLVERDWMIIEQGTVAAVEYEILVADGFVSLDALQRFSSTVRFSIEGVKLPVSAALPARQTVVFSDIFTLHNIEASGLLGAPRAKVRVNEEKKTIAEPKTVNCYASHFNTNEILSLQRRQDANSGRPVVCSVAVTLPVSNPFTVAQAFGSQRVSLVLYPSARGLECVGPCNRVLISIRLLLPGHDPLSPLMLEISPQVHLVSPSSVSSSTTDPARFELEGPVLMRLVESHFRESLGFRDRDLLPSAMGLFDGILRRFTTEDRTGHIEDVWTTVSNPAADALEGAVAPRFRNSGEWLRAAEWCGFGEHDVCWYRYFLYTKLPK